MMVYVVTEGTYSDYHIERVFLSKDLAERYVRLVGGAEYEHYEVEAYEVTEEIPQLVTVYVRRVEISKRTAHVTDDTSDTETCPKGQLSWVDETVEKGIVVKRMEYTNRRINVPWITIWVRGIDKERVDKVVEDHVAKERAQLLAL